MSFFQEKESFFITQKIKVHSRAITCSTCPGVGKCQTAECIVRLANCAISCPPLHSLFMWTTFHSSNLIPSSAVSLPSISSSLHKPICYTILENYQKHKNSAPTDLLYGLLFLNFFRLQPKFLSLDPNIPIQRIAISSVQGGRSQLLRSEASSYNSYLICCKVELYNSLICAYRKKYYELHDNSYNGYRVDS